MQIFLLTFAAVHACQGMVAFSNEVHLLSLCNAQGVPLGGQHLLLGAAGSGVYCERRHSLPIQIPCFVTCLTQQQGAVHTLSTECLLHLKFKPKISGRTGKFL